MTTLETELELHDAGRRRLLAELRAQCRRSGLPPAVALAALAAASGSAISAAKLQGHARQDLRRMVAAQSSEGAAMWFNILDGEDGDGERD